MFLHLSNYIFTGRYYNFQRLSQWDELFTTLMAFVSFLSIIKTVHLLRFNRRVSMLGSTLRRAWKDLTSFCIVFFLVFVAFFCSGYMLFGRTLAEYSKLITCVETLMAVSLGRHLLVISNVFDFFFLKHTLNYKYKKPSLVYSRNKHDSVFHPFFSQVKLSFYTSTKSWRGYIFTAVCLCVCLSVCLCVRLNSCEQNSSQTDEPIWTRFSLNGCLKHWLNTY